MPRDRFLLLLLFFQPTATQQKKITAIIEGPHEASPVRDDQYCKPQQPFNKYYLTRRDFFGVESMANKPKLVKKILLQVPELRGRRKVSCSKLRFLPRSSKQRNKAIKKFPHSYRDAVSRCTSVKEKNKQKNTSITFFLSPSLCPPMMQNFLTSISAAKWISNKTASKCWLVTCQSG